MCGIFGVISFERNKEYMKRKDFMNQATIAGVLRGFDGTGVFAVPYTERNEEVLVHKKPMAGYDFVQLPKTQSIYNNIDFYKFCIGHHRAATSGGISFGATHPFTVDHITLVHNGTLTSPYQYNKDHHKFKVDSEMIAYAIATEGYVKAIEKITGGAALVWYDSKDDSLFAYRNKERPLFFVKIKAQETSFIASELSMLKWLCIRNGLEIEKAYEIKEDDVCVFTGKATPADVISIPHKIVNNYRGGYPDEDFFTNDKWKRRRKKQPNQQEILDSLNVKLGQRIKFSYDGIEFKDSHSRHGMVKGTLLQNPYCDVLAHGIDPKSIVGAKYLTGEVLSAWPTDQQGCDLLIVKDIQRAELTNSERMVKGPDNKEVTVAEFMELVKHGCAHCSAGLLPIHAELISWTANKEPLCFNCNGQFVDTKGVHLPIPVKSVN